MTAYEEHNTVQLSNRMSGAIDIIMPKIRSMIEDRMVAALHPEKRKIDLGTAERALGVLRNLSMLWLCSSTNTFTRNKKFMGLKLWWLQAQLAA
jgi:hypothetical protein